MIIPKAVIDELDYHSKDADKSVAIRWRGKVLTLRSGKSRWKSVAFARSALRQHLNYGNSVLGFHIAQEIGKLYLHMGNTDELKKIVDSTITELETSNQIEYVNL